MVVAHQPQSGKEGERREGPLGSRPQTCEQQAQDNRKAMGKLKCTRQYLSGTFFRRLIHPWNPPVELVKQRLSVISATVTRSQLNWLELIN